MSDLIAKGAAPLAYLMTLALPEAPERGWFMAFSNGLRRAQEVFGCTLAGGDTDRTPNELSVSITAFGIIPAGAIVRRSCARPGDHVYVSGTIGDATLGLKQRRDASLAGIPTRRLHHVATSLRRPAKQPVRSPAARWAWKS